MRERKEYFKKHYQENKERRRIWQINYYLINKEKLPKRTRGNVTELQKEKERERNRIYRLKNNEKIKERQRIARIKQGIKPRIKKTKEEKREAKRSYNRIYSQTHKQNKKYKQRYKPSKRRTEYARYYRNMKKRTDINFKLNSNLSRSLNKCLKRVNLKKQGTGMIYKLMGCSLQELREHLEKQFKDGMTWNNWGIRGWHIDHIYPLSKVNVSQEDDLKMVWNYKNLQPLWWYDNIRKRDKIMDSSGNAPESTLVQTTHDTLVKPVY